MDRSTLARRYLPLAVVLAVQLLIIAVVPSKAPTASGTGTDLTADGGFVPGEDEFGSDGVGGITGDTTATGEAIAGGGTGGGGTAAGGGPGGAAGGGGTGGGAAGGGGDEVASGDRSHCVDGRQFDPKIYYWAPPCVGAFTGKNGGATYQGVTPETVKIVRYYAKGNPAVDAILRAQGAFVTAEQHQEFGTQVAKFINENYELWGRKVEVKVVSGTCDSVPPDYRCLRNEIRQIIASEKPFIITWNTSLASPFFAEASAQKTVNIGGWHFRDQFSQAWAPYHYDVQISGTQKMQHFAEYWCKKLHDKNAVHAGDDAIKARKRVLGVISTNDPENKKEVEELKKALAPCGATVAHEYYYAQDISTADQQRRAAVAAMRENPESTSVLCNCDLVAPAFLYQTQEEQRYYPEVLINGSGFMDADKSARAYDTLLPGDPSCGCNHQFENAFGLSQISKQESYAKAEDQASRIWQAAGNQGQAPFEASSVEVDYYMMAATLIQAGGPNLTPNSVAGGVIRMGVIPGTVKPGLVTRSLNPQKGDYSWNDDMRHVYWSPTRPSTFDGEPGAYVELDGGRRFKLGEYTTGDVVLPPKPRG